jgi:hypothetical protein
VRAQGSEFGREIDACASESIVRSLSKGANVETHGSVTTNAGDLEVCDVWQLGLLFVPLLVEERQLLPFDELLRKGQNVVGVARRADGEHHCIVVELADANEVRRELWFESRYNYLIWKTVYTQDRKSIKQGAVRTEIKVTKFEEAAPTIFFPADVELNRTVDAKVTDIRMTTFSDIQVNEPLPPDVFDFRFPPGTRVFDRIMGKSYITDAEGNPAPGQINDAPAKVAPAVRSESREVSISEPTSWSAWILPCSLAALGGAFGLWVRSRWSMAKSSGAG